MDFKSNRFNLSLIILFIIYFVIMTLFFDINDLFIISLIITVIAFISQFVLGYYLNNEFNNFPLFTIAGIYLFAQIIISIFLNFFKISFNISVIIQVVLLGIFLILEFLLYQGKTHIEQFEKNSKDNIIFLSNFKKELKILCNLSDGDIKEELFNLWDIVKYSNPVSNNDSLDLENKILANFNDLKDCVNQNNNDEIVYLVNLLKNQFKEREIILIK